MAANKKIENVKQHLKNMNELGLPMRQKLFALSLLLLICMLFGVLLILKSTGALSAGVQESQHIIQSELNHISGDISKQYGDLSVEAVNLSKNISLSIETQLAIKGISTKDVKNHPELLEQIVTNEFERCLLYLQRSRSSGVYLILDATINSQLSNAENSKAGLYIKNMEPNIVNDASPYYLLLRGFADIGRNNKIMLHPQWTMEFNIENAPYYSLPIEKAKTTKLALSRLYYWNSPTHLPNVSEEVMLCSVPLIDSTGNVFGVCGLEISSMLFKLSNIPNDDLYQRNFCIFTTYNDQQIDISKAFSAGSYSVLNSTDTNFTLQVQEKINSFNIYTQTYEKKFLGFQQKIKLYPDDSAFSEDVWIAALLIPEEDVTNTLRLYQIKLYLLIFVLFLIGGFGAFFLSNYYIRPITKGLDYIKSSDQQETIKTKIPEIDALIDYLSTHRELLHKNTEEQIPSAIFDEFIKNTKTLSQAERAVFNLYVQGHNSHEIAKILCLSINTIKTHNKRIYMKLNVASREELILYINMLQEAGKEFQ